MEKKTPVSNDFQGYVKALWICVASIPLAIVFIFLLVRLGFFGELPSTEEITNPKSYLATEILSSDGNQIGTFFQENRVHVEYEEIPENLINALVSTEDEIGYAKDRLAAKPMIMYEDDDLVAIASEEVSLNRLFPGRALNTREPAPGSFATWSRSI